MVYSNAWIGAIVKRLDLKGDVIGKLVLLVGCTFSSALHRNNACLIRRVVILQWSILMPTGLDRNHCREALGCDVIGMVVLFTGLDIFLVHFTATTLLLFVECSLFYGLF